MHLLYFFKNDKALFSFQIMKPTSPPPPFEMSENNPFAVARPQPIDLMFHRQSSFMSGGQFIGVAFRISPLTRSLDYY